MLSGFEKSGRDLKLDFQFEPVSDCGYAWQTRRDNDHNTNTTESAILNGYVVPQPTFTDAYIDLLVEVVGIFQRVQDEHERKALARKGQEQLRHSHRADDVELSGFHSQDSPVELIYDYMTQLDRAIEAEKAAQISEENVYKFDAAKVILECLAFMYFRTPDMSLTESIKVWASHLAPGLDEELLSEVMGSTNPETHSMFWPIVIDQAVRGRFEVLERILTESILAETSTISDENVKYYINIAVELCQSYPDDDLYEFKKWRDSSKNSMERIMALSTKSDATDKSVSINPALKRQLLKLFSIFAGDEETIFNAAESWCVVFSALYMYCEPHPDRLREYYNKAVLHQPVDRTLICDECCSNIMEDRLLQTLKALENLDLGVAAAVGLICSAHGLLLDYSEQAQDVVEWLIVDVARKCVASVPLDLSELTELDDSTNYLQENNSDIPKPGSTVSGRKLALCKIGIDLLSLVNSDQSIEMVGELLPRIDIDPVTDNNLFLWALEQCRLFGLKDAELSIVKCGANKYLAQGQYVEALVGLSRIDDTESLASLSWKLFEHTLATGLLPTDPVTRRIVLSGAPPEELDPRILEALSPFAVLASFVSSIDADTTAAAQYLLGLIQFRHLPSRYVAMLLYLLRPLIGGKHAQNNTPILSAEDLVVIMTAVNEWDKCIDEDLLSQMVASPVWSKWLDRYQASRETTGLVQTTRILLAQEMARVLVQTM